MKRFHLSREARERLLGLLTYFHTDMLELSLALIAFAWGAFLLLPLDSYAATPAFRVMRRLPEELLGLGMALLGLAHLFAVLRGSVRARRWLAFVTAGVWTIISITFLLSSPASTAAITYPLLAFFSALIFLRLGVEV